MVFCFDYIPVYNSTIRQAKLQMSLEVSQASHLKITSGALYYLVLITVL